MNSSKQNKSDINWNDLDSNSLAELKREAKNRNLKTPPRPSKRQLIDLLSDSVKPTFVSNKFFENSDYSQHGSQNASPRGSPSPKASFVPPQKNTFSTPNPKKIEAKAQTNDFALENEFQQEEQQEEKREHSPLVPSSSSKSKAHSSSHKKSSHSTGERKVRVNSADRSHSKNIPISQPESYAAPRKFLIMNYLSASLALIFTLISIINPLFLIIAIVNGIIFYIVHTKLDSILLKKAYSLASKVTSYLENECHGSALKSQLKDKFNVDTYVMRRLGTFLTSKKRIEIKNKKDGDQVWKIIN